MEWLSLGPAYTLESFWDQTPATLNLAFEAARRRDVRAHDERMSLAYHTAVLIQRALNNPKRFPRLEKLLIRDQPTARREMTPDEQWRVMAAMAAPSTATKN